MLSDHTIQKLQQLYAVQTDYRPNDTIAAQLVNKTIVMFVGATCEGKNTVMEAVAAQDKRFKITGTYTSRDPRPGDDPNLYTYYQNTDDGLADLLAAIDRHEVVQYAVNPHANLIYGSTPGDYKGEYNLKDVFSSAIENFHHLGFKRSLAITIITEPTIWLKRFEERFPIGHTHRKARRDEAIESFSWSLAQPGSDHLWVENREGDLEHTAGVVIAACLGQGNGQPEARRLAELSLEYAKKISL
jgi:hypothetical protein